MLNIFYHNVRGLRTKTKQFYLNVLNNNYDIICLTETWLIKGIFDEELFDSRYNVYRKDRDYHNLEMDKGGGTLIAIRRDISVDIRNVHLPAFFDVDITYVSISFTNNSLQKSLLIFCCYFPQNSKQSESQLNSSSLFLSLLFHIHIMICLYLETLTLEGQHGHTTKIIILFI